MSRRQIAPASFALLAAALAAGVSCRDGTAPHDRGRGSLAAALFGLPSTPTIQSLRLDATKLALDAPPTPYEVTVRNPGALQAGILLQGEIVQGHATRAAGGFIASCPSPDGTLPTGTCTMRFTVTASNAAGGAGVLVAGPASFVLHLLRSDGVTTTMLDGAVVSVVLVDPAA
jgi:hypothetical protein